MQLVLLAAGIGSLYPLRQLGTGILLILLTLFNAIMGLQEEGKAAAAVAALQKMMIITAKVRRNGQLAGIPAGQLVPGDIVALEAGDIVPADGRLLTAAMLEVDESALTGESLPVAKSTDAVAGAGTPPGDRTDMVYMNTDVTRGAGEFVVTATGVAAWTPRLSAGRLAGGLVLSRKAAADLGAGVGSVVTFRHPQAVGGGLRTADSPVRVAGIDASPMRGYAYLDSATAAPLFGLAGMANLLSVLPSAGHSAADVQRALLDVPHVASARSVRAATDGLRASLDQDRKLQPFELAVARDRRGPRFQIPSLPATAYRWAAKLVSLPAESKNKVPVAVLPWPVRVTRAEVASTAWKEMLCISSVTTPVPSLDAPATSAWTSPCTSRLNALYPTTSAARPAKALAPAVPARLLGFIVILPRTSGPGRPPVPS